MTPGRRLRHQTWLALGVLLWAVHGSPAFAQEGGELPTVDELLQVPTRPPAKRDRKPIDRPVEEQRSGEPFGLAVDGMRQAANRLSVQEDPGIETQRIQEQVVNRLDMLISQMRRQQQQQQQSQAREQDSGSQQQTQSQPNEQNTQGGQDAAQQIGNRGQNRNDQLVDQPLQEQFDEWGNLPPRLRDALLDGTREQFSGLYRDLTRRYYQRLAEEAE